ALGERGDRLPVGLLEGALARRLERERGAELELAADDVADPRRDARRALAVLGGRVLGQAGEPVLERGFLGAADQGARERAGDGRVEELAPVEELADVVRRRARLLAVVALEDSHG